MTPSPLELITQGRFHELVALLNAPQQRERLLAEVGVVEARLADLAGNAKTKSPQPSGNPSFADRQFSMLTSGDFTWGLLTAQQRREFLSRDTRLLRGAGREDSGRAQLAALKRLRAELANLYDSLELALQSDDLEWLIPLAEHLADIEEITGEFESMLERYRAIEAVAGRLGKAELQLHAALGLSVAHSRLNAQDDARASAERALEFARDLKDQRLEAAALHMAGTAAAMQGELVPARELLVAAIDLRKALHDPGNTAASIGNLAYVEMCLGERAQARHLLTEARDTHRRLGNQRGAAMLVTNLAVLAYEEHDPACAELYKEALADYRELGDERGVATCLSGLGWEQYAREDFAGAAATLNESIVVSRRLGDTYIELSCELALGNIAYVLGKFGDAVANYEHSRSLATSAGDSQSTALAAAGLACALSRLGRHDETQPAIRLALEHFASAGNPASLATCLLQAAAVLFAAGRQQVLCAAVHASASAILARLGARPDPSDRSVAAYLAERVGKAEAGGSADVNQLAADVLACLREG